MRTVYAVQLEVFGSKVFEDLWDRAIAWVRDHQDSESAKAGIDTALFDDSRHPLPNDQQIQLTQSGPVDGAEFRELSWQHPDTNDASLIWAPQVTVFRTKEHVKFLLTLKVGAATFQIVPGYHDLARPRLVRDIVQQFSPTVSGWPLRPGVNDLSVDTLSHISTIS